MLVRPEQLVTETIAQLGYEPGRVWVRLPEKLDSFRRLVRGYGFTWDWNRRRWERLIQPAFTGPALDRAAETGRALLGSGFQVEFPDQACLDMALAESYAPEQTRWVYRRSGEYDGWLNIRWSRREDFYHEAICLTGARYRPPGVIVPPDRFDEVEDFAEINDFSLSPGAQCVIEAERSKRLTALVVNIQPPKPRKATMKAGPETYEIADELRDEPL